MSVETTVGMASPFDSIRHVDKQGEWWSARELMPLLGYGDWERVPNVIERARIALGNTDMSTTSHIRGASVSARLGLGLARPVSDYLLTRYACYLVAMNGDPRKPEIAAAQRYFAVKTREAEATQTQYAVPQSWAEALELAARQAREIEAKAVQLAAAAPKVDYVDKFVDISDDCTLLRDFAKQVGIREGDLRRHLVAKKILYVIHQSGSYDEERGVWKDDREYKPCADHIQYFVVKDQPLAPRRHNGQIRTTCYLNPKGKTWLAAWLTYHPIESAASAATVASWEESVDEAA